MCRENVFLEISQNSQKNTYARVFFLNNLIFFITLLKKTLAEVFSCEFYKRGSGAGIFL